MGTWKKLNKYGLQEYSFEIRPMDDSDRTVAIVGLEYSSVSEDDKFYSKEDVDALIASRDAAIAELKAQVNGHNNRANLWYYNAQNEHNAAVTVRMENAKLRQKLAGQEAETKSALKAVSHWHDSYCELQKVVDRLRCKLECKACKACKAIEPPAATTYSVVDACKAAGLPVVPAAKED